MIWKNNLLYQIMNIWFEIRIYLIISNNKLMIWNQDLLYQIINAWFEIRICYIQSIMYDII